MSILYLLIPLALLLAGSALAAFIWAARSGQYDDVDSAAIRAVVDDDGDGRRPEHPPHGADPLSREASARRS